MRNVAARRRRRLTAGTLAALISVVGVVACSSGREETQGVSGTTPSTSEVSAPPTTVEEVVAAPADVAALVDGALTAEGKRLFYAAEPRILDRADFAASCPNSDATVIVLGCYYRDRIYILRIERPELSASMEVAAAHELLHAAYEALTFPERVQVDQEINDYYRTIDDPELRDLIGTYDRLEPRQRLDELHSILPTTLRSLSPALEDYYARYFVSRSRFVDAYEKSEAPFLNLKARSDALDREITELKSRTDQLKAELDDRRATLTSLESQLDSLRASGDVRAYNTLVGQHETQRLEFNRLVDEYNATIEAHNARVEEANALALEQRELQGSLNSYS